MDSICLLSCFWNAGKNPLEKYTNTFCDLPLEMDEKTLQDEVAKRRGPLYAHGWQMMLRQLAMLPEHGSGRIVKLVLSGVYPALCQEAGPTMDIS